MLLFGGVLPDEDVVELHVGREGELVVGLEGGQQYVHELKVLFPHDVLVELVLLEIVEEGSLLIDLIVHDVELGLYLLL